ncbi:hypothetical protein HGT73_10785 [Rosenbergiella australiborealis]|uniref:Toxin CptA n=1 Tax=Rosenbergiella australiborealis TaxID=1544696 RepID=A0ABS5T676_9GAMM|nr:hypothetical protein [Rosenbergiella australiborealis]
MRAVLWQTEIHVSRYALYAAKGWMLLLLVVMLISPWFGIFYLLKPLAIIGLLYERQRTLRRLLSRVGTLHIDDQEAWYWQQQSWRVVSPLCWLPWGVMISWRCGQRHQHFWLMADSMSQQAWRNLRFYWLKGRNRQWK